MDCAVLAWPPCLLRAVNDIGGVVGGRFCRNHELKSEFVCVNVIMLIFLCVWLCVQKGLKPMLSQLSKVIPFPFL